MNAAPTASTAAAEVLSDRGILFSAPMILALQEGRKTQTRRLVDLDKLRVRLPSRVESEAVLAMVPALFRRAESGSYRATMNEGGAVSVILGDGKDPKNNLGVRPGEFHFLCPYAVGETSLSGEPGDRNRRWTIWPRKGSSTLWVREAWRTEMAEHANALSLGIRFAADNSFVPIDLGDDEGVDDVKRGDKDIERTERWNVAHQDGKHGEQWRNPLFLPHWASRYTLDVLRVRMERLQDITTEDILAEGVQIPVTDRDRPPGKVAPLIRFGGRFSPSSYMPDRHPDTFTVGDLCRAEWAAGWDSLNHKRASWASNPWIWALTFRRIEDEQGSA